MKRLFPYLAFLIILICHWFAISYLQSNFTLPHSVLFLHFVALGFAYWLLFLGLALVKSLIGNTRIFRYLAFLAVASILLFFSVVYLGNAVSLKEWGEYISFEILGLFFSDARTYLSMYGGIVPNLLRAVLLLLPVVVLAKPLSNLVDNSTDIFIDLIRKFSPSKTLQIGVIACVIGLTIYAFFRIKMPTRLSFKGEPVYSFFVPVTSNFGPQSVNLEDLYEIENYKAAQFAEKSDAKNLILIIVDALRADRLPMYGYPRNNAPFIQTLFENKKLTPVPMALSSCSTSFCGILSTLSGKSIHEMHTTNFKIHDVLKKYGYQTNFLLSGSHNEWYQIKRAYAHHYPLDVYYDGTSNISLNVSDDLAVLDRFRNLNVDTSKAQFFYFHLMSAHRSGIRQQQYRKYLPDAPLDGFNPDSLRFSNAYDNGVIQSDDYIKTIFSELENKGMLENSIVVITADHGEALGEKGRFGHAIDINQGNIHIPFLIYSNEELNGGVPEYISQAEVMAVLLDELNIDKPNFCNPEQTDITYHRQGNKLAVVKDINGNRYKIMTKVGLNSSKLYNLTVDPQETIDLSSSHPSIFEEMQTALESTFSLTEE